MDKKENAKLPFFSGAAPTAGADTFGYTWKECLRPARFFRIEMDSTCIKSLSNALDGRASDCCINSTHQFFALMEDETVARVDVRHTARYVGGLRFHTNKRVSQWFGARQGPASTLKAPDGFVIHSLAGKNGCRTPGYTSTNYVVELCALFSPVSKLPACELKGTASYSASPDLVTESGAYPGMRLILINTSSSLSGLTALSAWDVTVLSALRDYIELPAYEHVLELLPDERVVAVRLVDDIKVQFQTTHRTTPWYGNDTREDVAMFDATGVAKGAYVSGFHTYTSDARGMKKKKIGVVYWTPTTKTAA